MKLKLASLLTLFLVTCSVGPLAATPRAVATGPNESYVVLGDDVIDACPAGALAAVGKDPKGKEYVGCWYTDGSSVFVYWLNTKTTMSFDANAFKPIEPAI